MSEVLLKKCAGGLVTVSLWHAKGRMVHGKFMVITGNAQTLAKAIADPDKYQIKIIVSYVQSDKDVKV